MKTCPYCRMRISPKAVKCPFCQTAFSSEEVSEGKRENRKRTERYLFLILIAAGVAIWWLNQPGSVESLASYSASRDAGEASH